MSLSPATYPVSDRSSFSASVEVKPAAQGLYALGLAIVSGLYYALYITSGYNFTDDGNYAQLAYELALGRPLAELPLSYGLLWFKMGEILFALFGINFLFVKIVFFGAIVVTNVLIFYSVAGITGRPWLGVLAAIVPALVPAFPATAFYGLCVALNAAAQLRLARRLDLATWQDGALCGAALSLSFLLRPDFGYFFALPLLLVILLASVGAKGGVIARFRLLALYAVGGFVVVLLPALLVATTGGYAEILVAHYLQYPIVVAGYAVNGLKALLGGASETVTPASTLLQRPPPSAIFSGNSLALLIYLPVAIIAAFVIFHLANLVRYVREDRRGLIAQVILAGAAGVATLPHYLIYRPDMAHIANFMPGYTIFAAIFLWQLYAAGRDRRTSWLRPLGAAIAMLIGLNMATYAWAGLRSDGTGSIGLARGRTELFHAGNGVEVRLQPAEREQLEALRGVIEANSKPGDSIVCVPYCPGIAFMTGRRMFFREFYVDDAILLRDPGWIDRAIAETRQARPPVVIIVDWAVNGTDISRFNRWAAPYVADLEKIATTRVDYPGIAIYLLSAVTGDAIN